MVTCKKAIGTTLFKQCALLIVVHLSQPIFGQGFFFPDYDYVGAADFNSAVANPPASSPDRVLQRQRDRSRPPQFQASRGNELPPREATRRQQVGRVAEVPEVIVQREEPKTIAILTQINEHNEDGSYSYGYEAADGSFKLETRHKDGRVEGKYGYIDIDTGEVKVIQYGADMMGFQPEGDLPPGIVVPPPVVGNATFDYDYDTGDYVDPPTEERPPIAVNSVRVQNRARGNSAAPIPGAPTQNRGQNVRAPPTSRPNQGEEQRQGILPTPLAPSRSRFQVRPATPQQVPRRQPAPIQQAVRRPPPTQSVQPSSIPIRQEDPVNFFSAFQTQFDSNSLATQGLKPFIPQQQLPRRLPTQPTLAPRRQSSQPLRRPQENGRSINRTPSRQQELSSEEARKLVAQEFQEIEEIKSIVRNPVPVRGQIPQRGSSRRVVSARPSTDVNDPNSTRLREGTRSSGRARGSSRTRTFEQLPTPDAPEQKQRISRPIIKQVPSTEDPLEVLRSLQATAGGSVRQNVQQTSPPRSRPSATASTPTPRQPFSSNSKFSSFPDISSAPVTSSLPPRKTQPVAQSPPENRQRAQPTRRLPIRPQQPTQQEQPKSQQRRPIRIKSRPPKQQEENFDQQFISLRPLNPVIPPQQPPRRIVEQNTAQDAIRALPQQPPQTQNRFRPTPSRPLSPTAAVPSRSFQNQSPVDFDALISEFTGRRTPRPQLGQQPFLSFRPTPASNPTSGGIPSGAFIPRPAAAVPPAVLTPQGSSFQLVTQLGSS